jgi:hypothetical protein
VMHLWVGVGAAPGQFNLPQLHCHIGGDLYGSVSELLERCVVLVDPLGRQLGLLVVL